MADTLFALPLVRYGLRRRALFMATQEADEANFPRSWEVNPQVHERFAERAEQERGRRESIVELIKEASA